MIEYLIKRTDGDWFDFPRNSEPYRPLSIPYKKIEGWGNGRIEIDNCEISFSDEEVGIQVSFQGEIPNDRADQIIEEVRQNIEKVTGQSAESIQISD